MLIAVLRQNNTIEVIDSAVTPLVYIMSVDEQARQMQQVASLKPGSIPIGMCASTRTRPDIYEGSIAHAALQKSALDAFAATPNSLSYLRERRVAGNDEGGVIEVPTKVLKPS